MQKSTHTRSVTLRLYAIALGAAAIAFFVDQITKQFARGFATGVGPFPSILTTVSHENYGLIANLPVPLPLIFLLTVTVLAFVGWLLAGVIRARRQRAVIGLGILIGGALGNMVDRATVGYVFDWILLFERSAINLADVMIVVGVILSLTETRASSTVVDER